MSSTLARAALAWGAIAAFLAVALGAFGAHGLRARLSPEMMAIYRTAVEYHFYHALGLLVVGCVASQVPPAGSLRWSALLMGTGIVLFSGSLYTYALTGTRWIAAITPLGGLCFLGAWVCLAIAVLRR